MKNGMKQDKKKGKKRRRKTSAAGYTVEAAIIVPVVLAVIIALIQICFTYHDRVILREALEYAALCRTATRTGEHFDPESVEGDCFLSDIVGSEIQESSRWIEISTGIVPRRLVPLYFFGGDIEKREYSANRKKAFAKEKTILSEVLLDSLHVLE